MGNSNGSSPSDTMRGRVEGSRLQLWLLMRLNRYLLAGLLLTGIFAALVLLSFVGLSPFRTLVEDADALQNLFGSMLGPIITGVTLVVTIGQLVLSQELGPVGGQRERMQEAMKFRRDVERHSEFDVSPPEPAAFIRELIATIENNGERLRETMEDERNEEVRERIEAYVEDLDEHAESVREQLEDTQFGTFDVIWAALNFNYSWKIFEARQIQQECADALSEDAADALDGMIDTLEFFGPTREHFKTLYFQWELINLSRALLYAAIPSLVVAGGMLMYVDTNAVTGTTLGVDNLVWLTTGAFAVTLLPFMILLAFILRIATVAQRTLAMGPFILRETERDADSDI